MTNLAGRPFAIIGVHVGGASVKQTWDVMEREGLPWRSFVDDGRAGAGTIATRWNLSATPTFYVIDHEGVIRCKWAGPPGEKVMDAALERLLSAAEETGEVSPK